MLNNKVNKGFTKVFNSGKWYMVISNETPMTNDGKVYCGFDLIENKNSLYGFPVNQFGTIEEVKEELSRWLIEVDSDNDYMREIEEYFINILENQ